MALVLPPQEQPKHVAGTEQHGVSLRTYGIWVCIGLALLLFSLCIYGVSILIRKCKTFSTSSHTTATTLPPRHPAPTVSAPQLPHHAIDRPNFTDTSSSISTCSTACSSPRDHRPPTMQPQPTQPQTRPPPLPAPIPTLSIMELCCQQYADQQKGAESPSPLPLPGSSNSQKHRFLGFWKHS